ncbi:hypothetical protein JN11_02448 [Mucilaginibacter frigoritolerans]|uniref:ATP synthase protein I n=1 Tax=Mucilaginibacter frigoritolerans TaxID=652788 RepID=A0A562U2E3_9SPHI|nr:hypothetical protein [Mucilaginibacter frigoritolerans]TWJ00033.1 hypothetical protein JN11_02448 [Mucilaginibacter frigoritolerans]
MKTYKSIITFLLFTCLVAVPPLALKYSGLESWLVPGFWGMFFFVAGLTFIVLLFILTIQAKNTEMYAPAFLGATTFKLLACLIFLLVFIKTRHPEKVFFVVDFMYLYLLNTVFEIYGLLRNLRNQNSK